MRPVNSLGLTSTRETNLIGVGEYVMVKRVSFGFWIAAGIGLCIAVGFMIASGIQYRLVEDAGLEPGYTPGPILAGIYAGLILLALGLTGALVTGVSAWIARRR